MLVNVCSMVRHHNKKDFIEWVKYHLDLGFDEFYVIDNSSDFSLLECANNEINDKRLVIKELPGDDVYQNDEFLKYLKNTNADWTLFIDSDEFLWFPDYIWKDVHVFLEDHLKIMPKDIEALAIYWKFISSNNYIQSRNNTQLKEFHDVFDYEHHNIKEIKQRTLVKSFFKKSASRFYHENHYPVCNYIYDIFGRNISKHVYDDDLVFKDYYPCIRHYYYKTADEWIKKHRTRDASAKNRIYPGSDRTDEDLLNEYKYCIKFFKHE